MRVAVIQHILSPIMNANPEAVEMAVQAGDEYHDEVEGVLDDIYQAVLNLDPFKRAGISYFVDIEKYRLLHERGIISPGFVQGLSDCLSAYSQPSYDGRRFYGGILDDIREHAEVLSDLMLLARLWDIMEIATRESVEPDDLLRLTRGAKTYLDAVCADDNDAYDMYNFLSVRMRYNTVRGQLDLARGERLIMGKVSMKIPRRKKFEPAFRRAKLIPDSLI